VKGTASTDKGECTMEGGQEAIFEILVQTFGVHRRVRDRSGVACGNRGITTMADGKCGLAKGGEQMTRQELLDKLERLGVIEHPFSGQPTEFSLYISTDHASLETSQYQSKTLTNPEWQDYSCTAILDADAVVSALYKLVSCKQSLFYDVVTFHTISKGRDEVGRYDQEWDTPDVQLQLGFLRGTNEVSWTGHTGRRVTKTELFDELYEDPSDRRWLVPALVTTIGDELKRWLATHVEQVYDLSPRRFEELVACILHDLGFDVELTRATRDGGVDIYAYIRNQVWGTMLMIVECKRWARTRRVGVQIVQRLFGVQQSQKANKSLLVTTSFYSADAIREGKKHENLMTLADYNDLRRWLEKYR